ncbi:FecR domain-containing protein [Pedobacter panaciterrae]
MLWKNGEFSFNSEEMGAIMHKVARWFNVEVIFNNPFGNYTTANKNIGTFAPRTKRVK